MVQIPTPDHHINIWFELKREGAKLPLLAFMLTKEWEFGPFPFQFKPNVNMMVWSESLNCFQIKPKVNMKARSGSLAPSLFSSNEGANLPLLAFILTLGLI
jgi:hypothetical protein